ncbi:histidine phosphatase superfamily [Lophiotrema nucula]|uniref:Histidine phosphatase superfamily n=1 Tax=Lophiotrema nucula TaxID=690887 RepID=A0A6A5Z1F5_9PLEO|nr:histidine phosphatase superfamily [Lophiotrema nucula]
MPSQSAEKTENWKLRALLGFFSHDSDPADWSFRAVRNPPARSLCTDSIGRRHSLDLASLISDQEKTPWQRFEHHIRQLNAEDPAQKRYKVFFVMRHGEGLHNVKEAEVGREAWERTWARKSGDDHSIWEDAELTLKGEQQAKDAASFWEDAIRTAKVPLPELFISSPLRRCLRTLELTFSSLVPSLGKPFKPRIDEQLRERCGVHTCDKRSTRSWIASAYPTFTIPDGFAEDDQLWTASKREQLEEHVTRTEELLGEIFQNEDAMFVSLTAHSGVLMALFKATGYKMIPVAAGTIYPLFVKAEKSSI